MYKFINLKNKLGLIGFIFSFFVNFGESKYQIDVANAQDFTKMAYFITEERICICLKNTKTYWVESNNCSGGYIKVFWSDDCTGS